QIEPPSPLGDHSLHGLELSWRRFVTDQTTDFMKAEIDALRKGGATQPVTTNFMYNFTGLNYHVLAKELDFVSFDNYPLWGKQSDLQIARDCAFWYDVMRSFKKKPFYLMESCPSATNWQSVSKLKKPGLLQAASLQAVAHGSDSVGFFQLRQSRGASEKFHGAVIDQYGGEDTRVFGEVCALGATLKKLAPLAGARTKASCAVVFDWENRWALENAAGPRNKGLYHVESVQKHYLALRKLGINVDLIDMEDDLSGYEVLALPMLYMLRCGMEEKIRSFIARGGVCVMTCWSGVVDEDDLCHLGGRPHGLMDVFGLRAEEIDALYDGETNEARICFEAAGRKMEHPEKNQEQQGQSRVYTCYNLCDLVKPMEGTVIRGTYGKAFYAGYPALLENWYKEGTAYYVCADFEQRFYDDLYASLLQGTDLQPIPGPLPEGLEVTLRETEEYNYLILQNFSDKPLPLPVPDRQCTALFGKTEGCLESLESAVWCLRKF
ncbi:MAG: beta-galactosidase trimerization domain-containing protein, partial [Lachnospiraceae bacterium]|nr:beta-galactosidase trimerization domain-containing protein [Lachnospiraceae bacterium]